MAPERGGRLRRRPRRAGSGAGLASVRNRLVLLFFAITTAAVGFVYIYVVPQLSSSMTAERLERLERQGSEELDRLRAASTRDLSQRELAELVRKSAADVDARVSLLAVRDGRPAFVIADSELESEALDAAYPAAIGAAASGEPRSGVESVRGRRIAESAFPVPEGEGVTDWVIVLSTPLDDVADNVALIRRQTLIAGAIALVAALIAAYLAASFHARRLQELERAAERVARGDFSVPIPVGAADEVGQLALTLDQMQRRLRRLDSARREFIANASHELRTPIASLGGFVELLDEEPEPDRESRREFVRTMRGQIDRLTKLSTDLLDLSRLDAGAVSLSATEFAPGRLIAEVAAEFAAAAERERTEIEVEPAAGAARIDADRARTAQIMRILIDNAIKHTPPGTEITISTTATPDACLLSVADDGPGIDRDEGERIFERFYTADSASGTGLGLAIGRELARLMGGDVVFETRRRRTVFTLTLPRAAGSSA